MYLSIMFFFLAHRDKCQSATIKSEKRSKIDEKSVTSWLNGQVFHVEAILGKRAINDSIEYLVKWKGWSNTFNSWESKETILKGSKPKDREKEDKNVDQNQVIRFWKTNLHFNKHWPRI